jgi:YVTN family beta-propeller protein
MKIALFRKQTIKLGYVFILLCLLALNSGLAPITEAHAATPFSVIATIPLGSSPYAVAVNENTNRIYVTHYDSNTVSVIDGNTNTVVATVPVISAPNSIGINSVTNKIYVSNGNGGSALSVIDGNTNTVVAEVLVDINTRGVAVNQNTNQIYVPVQTGQAFGPYVNVIDGSSNTVTSTILGTGIAACPMAIALNQNLNRIYVSDCNALVRIIDTNTDTYIPNVATGSLAFNPITNRLYMVGATKYLTIMDGVNNTVLNTLTVPMVNNADSVFAIDVNPSTNHVFVGHYLGGVSVFDGATNTFLGDSVSFTGRTLGVAVNSVTNRVYLTSSIDNSVVVLEDTASFQDCTPDDLNPAQWNMEKIHLVDALNQFPNCQVPSVKIAIIDTGVDILRSGAYHPELVGQIAFTDTAVGKNAKDRNGHGTHVAGIIGATQDNGIGIVGIVPHPQLYIYKYSDQWNDDILRTYERLTKYGTNDIEIIAKFIRAAVDLNQNIRVINISSGNMPYDLERPLGKLMVPSECKNADGTPKFDCNGILKSAIEYAQQHNVIIVVAAGHTQNGVPGFDGYRFPAAYAGLYSNVIAVASSRPTNEVGYYNITGNYITVAAPGGADIGCMNGREDCVLGLWLQGDYKELEGTSMSAPHVTGVIGLMLAANPYLTPEQVKNILRCTATDFVIDPTRYAGAGIVDADGAVRAAFVNNTQCPQFP